jgi:hypothetical protein
VIDSDLRAADGLARIVRGADTDDRGLTPESAGLYAAATGFHATSRDDFDNMARQFPMYDAFYEFSRLQAATTPARQRVLFVCLHGAAKSVIATAYFNKLARDRGLSYRATFRGTSTRYSAKFSSCQRKPRNSSFIEAPLWAPTGRAAYAVATAASRRPPFWFPYWRTIASMSLEARSVQIILATT